MAQPKPTRPLNSLKKELEQLRAPWEKSVLAWRGLYYKTFQNLPQLPEGVPIHKASTARNIVDNLADQIRTDEPRVDYAANGRSQAAQKNKELLETWGRYVFSHLGDTSVVDPWEQAKKDLLRDSAACIKYTIDVDALPDAPERANFPSKGTYEKALRAWRVERASVWYFDVRSVDPLQVYVPPTRKTKYPYVVEAQQRLATDVRDDYPGWSDPKRPKNGEDSVLRKVDWLEYWSDDHYLVEVDGERIIDKANPYGAPPYEFRYNGLGRNDASGSPARLGESVLEANVGEFEAEVRVKTAMDAQWQFHVFPRLITTENAAKARRQFMKGPGSIIEVPSMEQAPRWLETPQPNVAMVNFLAQIQGAIQQRFPSTLNQRPAGVEAAVHQALLQGQATKPLLPIKKALNRMATGVLVGLARQMVRLGLDMNIFGNDIRLTKDVMVKASDFKSFNFNVEFEATDPAEDDRKLLTGLALLRVPGTLSRRGFREKFAKALQLNSEEEEEQILVEKFLDVMAESGIFFEQVLQEMAAAEQQEQQEALLGEQRAGARQAAEGFVPGARERGLASLGAGPQEGPGPTANPILGEV